MPISVTDPITKAFDRAKLICFSPFDGGKWFTMGFCAFLAMLGEAAGPGFNCFMPDFGGRNSGGFSTAEAARWVENHLTWIVAGGSAGLALVAALYALLLWLGSRGKFMFIDGIVHNRGAVSEPWNAFKRLGNSLFRLRFVVFLVSMGCFLLVGAVALVVAWPDIQAARFGTKAILVITVGGLLGLLMSLTLAIANLLVNDFVPTIMYQRQVLAGEALRLFVREIAPGNTGVLVLYILMRWLLAIGVAMAATMVMCATCCIAAIPYLGTVILLPAFVFTQSYPLYMLQQFGPHWRVFFDSGEICPVCGYDLRGSVGRPTCPECGAPIQLVLIPLPDSELPPSV